MELGNDSFEMSPKRLKNRKFRTWWQIPRKNSPKSQDRQVSFLELFYDLVYVAIIAQLSHSLADNITFPELINFTFLFVIIWWSWSNGAFYHDMHGNNDLRTRIFTFLQMLGVVGMAIFVNIALTTGSNGFALSVAFLQFVLMFLWWRAGVHHKELRTITNPYIFFFLINTTLLVSSIFFEAPIKHILWLITIGISLLLPAFIFNLGTLSKKIDQKMDVSSQITPSLVERFGLFTIIVLGEIVVGVVSGATHGEISITILLYSGLGTLIAVAIWWLYFDFISHRKPKSDVKHFLFWYYFHLPLMIAITAVGASVFYMINHSYDPLKPETQFLFCGALAVASLCMSLLSNTLNDHSHTSKFLRNGTRSLSMISILFIGMAFFPVTKIALLSSSLILLLLPILYSFIKNQRNLTKA